MIKVPLIKARVQTSTGFIACLEIPYHELAIIENMFGVFDQECIGSIEVEPDDEYGRMLLKYNFNAVVKEYKNSQELIDKIFESVAESKYSEEEPVKKVKKLAKPELAEKQDTPEITE